MRDLPSSSMPHATSAPAATAAFAAAAACAVRPARPGEEDLLTALCVRSKESWGYDAGFMAASHDALVVRSIGALPTFVATVDGADGADGDGAIAGVYQMQQDEVSLFFVDPAFMRRGVGRTLWRHLVDGARATGFRSVEILSDPHAEAFYLAMGAVRVGQAPSDVFGAARPLPLLRYQISP